MRFSILNLLGVEPPNREREAVDAATRDESRCPASIGEQGAKKASSCHDRSRLKADACRQLNHPRGGIPTEKRTHDARWRVRSRRDPAE
jgi:hypothetical protein